MHAHREVKQALQRLTDPVRAKNLQRFFKTAPGQYGAGDRFFGLTVPMTRQLVKEFATLPLKEIDALLASAWHEERLLGLLILVRQFQKGDHDDRKKIVGFYLAHTDRINNWDLVDATAPYILGQWLLTHPKAVLTRLAKSSSLWERRIAMVTTFAFIRAGDPSETFRLTKLLWNDREDLMHKAIGWMLREVGKHSGIGILDAFLKEYAAKLPRTALRYAIERHSLEERKNYLAIKREKS